MNLKVTKILQERTEVRVKSVDLHPKKPYLLVTFFTGEVKIWNYESGKIFLELQPTDTPVRTGVFIERENWFAIGSDDCKIRVYNIDNGDLVKEFNAHNDYIRSIDVHKNKSHIVSCAGL